MWKFYYSVRMRSVSITFLLADCAATFFNRRFAFFGRGCGSRLLSGGWGSGGWPRSGWGCGGSLSACGSGFLARFRRRGFGGGGRSELWDDSILVEIQVTNDSGERVDEVVLILLHCEHLPGGMDQIIVRMKLARQVQRLMTDIYITVSSW